MISISMDSNEQKSRRAEAIYNVVKKHKDTFRWENFAELPVDIRFQSEDSRYLNCELKEADDLVSSVLSGHLATQVTMMKEANVPGFIVCIGSVESTLATVPTVMPGKRRAREEVLRDCSRIKHFCATSYTEGYPVFFWDTDWSTMILYHAADHFNNPSVCDFLKKKGSPVQEAIISMIPGIGGTTARVLIDQYGTIRNLSLATVEVLAETKINGKKLGKKAEIVYKALNR
jgi:hypothetical protein